MSKAELNEAQQAVSDYLSDASHHTIGERDVEGTVIIEHEKDIVPGLLEASGSTLEMFKQVKKSLDNLLVGHADSSTRIAHEQFGKDEEVKSVRSVVDTSLATLTSNTQRNATINIPGRDGAPAERRVVPGYNSNSLKVRLPKTALKAVGVASQERCKKLAD